MDAYSVPQFVLNCRALRIKSLKLLKLARPTDRLQSPAGPPAHMPLAAVGKAVLHACCVWAAPAIALATAGILAVGRPRKHMGSIDCSGALHLFK